MSNTGRINERKNEEDGKFEFERNRRVGKTIISRHARTQTRKAQPITKAAARITLHIKKTKMLSFLKEEELLLSPHLRSRTSRSSAINPIKPEMQYNTTHIIIEKRKEKKVEK